MSNDTVHQLEENIRQHKAAIELDKAVQRLCQNRDFVEVVKKGYLEQEAIRLVHLKADPSMASAEKQASIVAQIDAIGGLVTYFRTIGQKAALALKGIEQDEAVRDELLAGDAA